MTNIGEFPGLKLVGITSNFKKRILTLSWCVHVLHKTWQKEISRRCCAEYVEEIIDQNLHAREWLFFFLRQKLFFLHLRCRRRCNFLNSHVMIRECG